MGFEMTEYEKPESKLESGLFSEVGELEEKMGVQKISVSDHINGFQYTAEKSDNFVIDMGTISPSPNTDLPPSSRITRSLSRKGSQRVSGGEKKTSSNMGTNERETAATSSPKAAPVGSGMPEKLMAMAVGTTDNNQQAHHQITIAANSITGVNADTRSTFRKNSFRRPSQSWLSDPKRVLFFFATLSSMGTILLIYFTLTISQPTVD